MMSLRAKEICVGDGVALKPPNEMIPICNLGRQQARPHPLALHRPSLGPLRAPSSAVRFRVGPPRAAPIRACASGSEIDMVRDRQGIYQPKQKRVVILWDLDNKPPRGPPYSAAVALKTLASKFGHVTEASAYANRHAFVHLPQWVLDQRRDRRSLDVMERKGIVAAAEPYVCGVCGRKCKTNLDLKKHFKQLHERERKKKVNRMNSLKGKKKQRFKERYITGNEKYTAAAREILTPKVGYGLAGELRRAGVVVRTVEDKPQAADWALKRQMQHSMSSGVDWLLLVSDDSDFSEMLRRARAASLGTVVVGDWDKALGRQADVWVPWVSVENGNISDRDLVPRRRPSAAESFGDEVSISKSDEEEFESDEDGVVLSAFSEAEGFDERFDLFDSDDEEEDGIF